MWFDKISQIMELVSQCIPIILGLGPSEGHDLEMT